MEVRLVIVMNKVKLCPGIEPLKPIGKAIFLIKEILILLHK